MLRFFQTVSSRRFSSYVTVIMVALTFGYQAEDSFAQNKKKQQRDASVAQDRLNDPIHQAENAVGQFEIHPELDVELFAAEPLLANPVEHRC